MPPRMAESDPIGTQRAVGSDIRAELSAEGLAHAEEIGRGGFGAVYCCEQPELDRTVAVKVLTAGLDPDNLERFLREQRAMGRLSGHPHIVHWPNPPRTGRCSRYTTHHCQHRLGSRPRSTCVIARSWRPSCPEQTFGSCWQGTRMW